MTLEEFDCVVLGDEPAGLWALSRLALPVQGKASFRLGWLAFSDNALGASLSTRSLPNLGLSLSHTWNLEIVAPHEAFLWEEKALESRFPGLDLREIQFVTPKGEVQPRARDLAKIGELIRRYPDLYIYSSGVWKFIGRSASMRPENMVWGALLASELVSWHAADEVPTGVTRIRLPDDDEPALEEIRGLNNGSILIKVRGREAILARRLILNGGLSRLLQASSKPKELMHVMNLDEELSTTMSLYPLKIRTKTESIPCSVRPLTLYFETSEIPDLDNEVWPIQRSDLADGTTEITIWISALKQASLEGIVDRFRSGFQRLNRLFPFLSMNLLELSSPLNVDECLGSSQRATAKANIERSAVDLYALTTIDTRTRVKNLFALNPFVHCELPYPLGPLQEAKRFVLGVIKKQPAVEVQAPA